MLQVDFAIKFGSNEIEIYRKGIGFVAKEPAFLAVTPIGKRLKVRAVGSEAEKLYLAKTSNILVYQPIKNSEVTDKKLAAILIKQILKKCIRDNFFFSKFNALVAVPCALSQKQLHLLKNTLHNAGIDKMTFVQNAVCVRAFMKNSFAANQTALFVDIGKYLTDISILNDSTFFAGRNLLIGGNDMDVALQTYIKDNFNLEAAMPDVEKIKNELGSLYSRDYFSEKIVGLTAERRYKEQVITANEVRVAITNVYNNIFNHIKEFLNEQPNEIVAEVYKNGMVLSGGGACISGLYEYAKKSFDLPIYIDDNANDVVLLGAGKLLHTKDHLKINL